MICFIFNFIIYKQVLQNSIHNLISFMMDGSIISKIIWHSLLQFAKIINKMGTSMLVKSFNYFMKVHMPRTRIVINISINIKFKLYRVMMNTTSV